MAAVKGPGDEFAPLCACGCNLIVNWMPGKGWAKYRKGHQHRGKPGMRLGRQTSTNTKHKQSIAALNRYKNKRRRDVNPIGPGVYATAEYRKFRALLVTGKPCCICGSFKNVAAHHQIPGNDRTLVPVCRKCHPSVHAGPLANGRKPPKGKRPPLCACGCKQRVAWKRVRGWATYCRGHGNSKIPGGQCRKTPPFCSCGCGKPVSYRFGKGWSQYKRGHEQRIVGHYTLKQRKKEK